MEHIVTANNSEVLRLLGSRGCERLGLLRRVVASGEEALEATRRLRPRLAILDADMPGLDGYEVCRQIKADPETSECRVVLVVGSILTRSILDRLAEVGCDDVVVLPAIGPDFFAHISDLLGVPRRRSRRVAVELMARLDAGSHLWEGHVENLSLHGAKVHLYEPLAPVRSVRIRLSRNRGGRGALADARVVWRQAGGRVVGLEFGALTHEGQKQLEALVLWDVTHEDGMLRVYLEGEFVESSEFAPLAEQLSGRVDFDAAGVRYINSHGSRQWCSFLASLRGVHEYTFSRCSIAFTTQAAMIPAFIGRGRIISFHAPYRCDRCERDEMRLLQVAAVLEEGGERVVPRFRCPGCQGSLTLDELPERFLAFLDE